MRTTCEHRAAVAAWRAFAPANDSDILPPSRPSNPRHTALSEDLAVILKWRALSQPPAESLRTNWSIVPSNDNHPEEEHNEEPAPPILECQHEIRPREAELIKAVKDVVFEPARLGLIDRLPVAGDIETSGGKIIRLGALRFGTLPTQADGTATKPGNDRHIIAWRGKRPVDRFARAKGGDLDEAEEHERRERLAIWLGCDPGEFIPRARASRAAACARAERVRGKPLPPLPPTSMSLNEARAFAGLPPTEGELKPALPTGAMSVGDIFSSWVVSPKKANSGAMVSDNDSDLERGTIASKLLPTDVLVLDAALWAKNMSDIGNVIGFQGKVAERKGKQALQAACKRLTAILQAA